MNNAKNVNKYIFGENSLLKLSEILIQAKVLSGANIYFIDEFFKNNSLFDNLPIRECDLLFFVQTKEEPKTTDINFFRDEITRQLTALPTAVIAIGGGCTLDTGKAVSNLLTNLGDAEDYQGWDLVKNPGIFKIGIPTVSGTGAEASRTCVMTNAKTGLKLGMNSDFTIYDQLILDPNLTKSVPRAQFFYTGMDTYIHCIESLAGHYRNQIGDAFSHQSINLCRDIFHSDDMMSTINREKMMVASYLGGCAIANSFVGVVHPFSAGLSVVLHIHHGVGNVIALNALEEFYKNECRELREMAKIQNVEIPKGICKDLSADQFEQLYNSTIVHHKPLSNALGPNFRDILTKEKVISLFKTM